MPHTKPHPAPRRRFPITLAGAEGKPWRIAIGVAAGLLLLLLIFRLSRVEPQLMSAAEVRSLQERGVLRVGVRTDIPGLAEDGAGLEIELGQRLAARLLPDIPAGNACKLVEVNAMDTGPKFNDGSIDIAIAMMKRGDSAKYAYSRTYYTDPCYFVVSARTQRLELQNVSVGYVQNTPAAALLDDYVLSHPTANITQVKFAAYPDMIQALMKGNIDLLVMTERYIQKYKTATAVNPQTLLTYYLYDFRPSSVCLGYVDYAIASPADSPALTRLADVMLQEMREDGSLAALYNQYGLVQDYDHEED